MSWESIAHWSGILGDACIVAGLFFSGAGFWREAHARRAQTRIEIIKLHRDLWIYYGDHPELAGLLDAKRDMTVRPLTDEELRFANLFFIHLSGTRVAEKAGSYSQPDKLGLDLREVFSNPAMSEAWAKMRHLHDADFVAFVEKAPNA